MDSHASGALIGSEDGTVYYPMGKTSFSFAAPFPTFLSGLYPRYQTPTSYRTEVQVAQNMIDVAPAV